MKLFDWLGAARRENDEVNADALRIASLEAANADLKAQTRAANIKAMVWQTKAEDLQDKLDEARNTIGVSDAQYEGAQAALKAAQPELARGVTKGVLHKNTVARKMSRLSSRVKAVAKA